MSLYRKILVACDGTGASDVALQQGADLTRSFRDTAALPWNSSAIILWLPEGEVPNGAEHFICSAALHPPECNPMACWDLRQAVSHIAASHDDHGKRPWIKVGEVVLSPTDLLRSAAFYKHHYTRK